MLPAFGSLAIVLCVALLYLQSLFSIFEASDSYQHLPYFPIIPLIAKILVQTHSVRNDFAGFATDAFIL